MTRKPQHELIMQFMLVPCLVYSSTLKMKAICFSEIYDEFRRETRGYIREDRTIHNDRCENLRSNKLSRVPEDGGCTSLRNVKLLPDYMA
jgi:hypothetical protein